MFGQSVNDLYVLVVSIFWIGRRAWRTQQQQNWDLGIIPEILILGWSFQMKTCHQQYHLDHLIISHVLSKVAETACSLWCWMDPGSVHHGEIQIVKFRLAHCWSVSNVILVDKKFTSSHQYLR